MTLRTAILAAITTAALQLQAQKNDPYTHFKKDITYLSSDALEGRQTGSKGEKLSADYIAAEFEKAGLKPIRDTGVQTFDIVQLRIPTSKTEFKMFIGSAYSDFAQKFTLHEDYFPLSESNNNDSVSGEVLYCNYGLEAPQLGFDDYRDLKNTEGKIFAIKMGFPGDDSMPHSPVAAFAAINTKIKTAISHGAAGIIFFPGSKAAGEPEGSLKRNAITVDIPVIYFRKIITPELHISASIKTAIAAPTAKAHNVYAFKNNHKKRTVIICAHHDHLGYNEYGGSLYTGPSAIHNGADDNASGVAAMLQLARDLKGRKYRKNNYLFVAFSGEEMGLLGSKYFIQHSPVPLSKINYVINIDMLGRLDSTKRTLVINGTGTSPVWNKSIDKVKTDSSAIRIVKSESGLGPSDHASFYLENIPVLHFFTGQHADYHKPSDDEDKINYAGMVQSYEVIKQVVANTNKAGKLEFTKTKDVQPGRASFKVTLGVMPDYAFGGSGVKIDGVSEGKPAAIAGLKKGDVIIRLGDWEISNMQDYTKALGHFNKGDKTKVVVYRDDTSQTFDIEFK